MPRAVLLLAVTAMTAVGCSKHPGGGGAPASPAPGAPAPAHPAGHLSGTPPTDKIVNTFKGAGLNPEGFAPLDPVPFGAGYCEQGRIEGVDTLICEFADDGSLDRGKRLLHDEWGREGVHTGVTTVAKHTLLAIADRGHHDPNGKTIHQILTAFKKI
jgi:hypothetical protein